MGRPATELTGQVFGRLTVVERAERPAHRRDRAAFWHCVCTCGTEKIVCGQSLTTGHSTSCGCRNREAASARYKAISAGQAGKAVSHGHHLHGRPTPTYHSWLAMRKRCLYAAHPAFHRYGGRGITICARWRDSFAHFLADMGERPEGLTLDRIDNDGNYEPGNCRWATPLEQRHNQSAQRTPAEYEEIR